MTKLIVPDWHPQAILSRYEATLVSRKLEKSNLIQALRNGLPQVDYIAKNPRLLFQTNYIRGQLLNDALQRMEKLGIYKDNEQYDWMQKFSPRALPEAMISGAQAPSYFIYNSALATTAAPVKQPTGNAIRTMMQLRMALSINARLIAWGFSYDGSAAATPGQVELFENTVAATMSTAYAAGDVQPFYPYNATANTAGSTGVPLNLSTTTSGFATAAVTEGTVATYRGADLVMAPPTGPYVFQWPLGREFEITPQNYVRVRVTFGTTVNMYIWVQFEI